MGKSMRKFKKLAVLAITIPTLLSSYNAFATQKDIASNETNKGEYKYADIIRKSMNKKKHRDGLGSFNNVYHIRSVTRNGYTPIIKETVYEELVKKYGITNANIVVVLNYMRSCIHLNSVSMDNPGEIMKQTILGFLKDFLNGTAIDQNCLKAGAFKPKDAWASFKYVLDLMYEVYIIKNQNIGDNEIKYVLEFIIRANDIHGASMNNLIDEEIKKHAKYETFPEEFHIGSYTYSHYINKNMLKYLYETFSEESYKTKYGGGNYSFGKFALENTKKVLAIHTEEEKYKFPEFKSDTNNVYISTLPQQKEKGKKVKDNAQEKSPKQPESLIRKRTKTIKNENNKELKTKPNCPKCGNNNVARNGHRGNNQRYICGNGCGCFTLNENGKVVTRKTRKDKDYKKM